MTQAYADDDVPRLERVARAAADRWGLSPETGVELINLSENATYLLREPGAETPLVLRVGRPGYSTAAEIASELAWVEALAAAGAVRTAPVVRTPGGETVVELAVPEAPAARPCVVFGFCPGAAPDEDGDATVLRPCFRVLGRLAAGLHAHAAGWTPPPGFTRRTWDHATTVGARPIWGRWEDGPGVGPAERELLGRLAGRLGERLAAYGRGPERFGLVHADMRLANVLFDGEDAWVIDFDDSGYGWFLYDLAAALTFIEDRPDVPALVAEWLDGYREVRPLGAEDVAMVPTLIMLRRLLVLAWIGSHANTPLAREEGIPYTRATCGLAERYLAGDGPGE